MKTSQLNWVAEQLRRKGYIRRNHCLAHRITRLASIIDRLKGRGWNIEARNHKTSYGKDYEYYLPK